MALVQDFLNTRPTGSGGQDLLTDLDSARSWLDSAVAEWASQTNRKLDPPEIAMHDVVGLRELRSAIESLIDGEALSAELLTHPAEIALTNVGQLRLEPVGIGWRWLASALVGEILLAQRADTWKHLKLCRNPYCHTAFYDRTKNGNGVWHDVKTCGNSANLRASRARRRKQPD